MREIPFALDARLSLCAARVRPGMRVADIGTDHAYLPVWLTRRGVCPAALAVDLHPGPLERARETVEKYRAAHLVEVRRSNGLQNIGPHEADDIVIAGMGGETIAAILSVAPWLRDFAKRLILQPMSGAEELRAFLAASGFQTRSEDIASQGGRLYPVIRAVWSGTPQTLSLCERYAGRVAEGDSPYAVYYLRKQAARLYKRGMGLRAAGDATAEAEAHFAAAERIEIMMGGLPGREEKS